MTTSTTMTSMHSTLRHTGGSNSMFPVFRQVHDQVSACSVLILLEVSEVQFSLLKPMFNIHDLYTDSIY